MPARKLPGDEYPDPMSLIKDPGWEDNWPMLILRGIYSIMARERKAGRGTLRQAYVKAFNVVILSVARKSSPRLITVDEGVITLTSYGHKRDEMSRGLRRMDDSAKRRWGKKSRADMQKDTRIKMKKLRIWIDMLVHELPDAQPVQSPTRIP